MYENFENNNRNPIGRNQKIAVTVLGFFAVFTFGLWIYQLKSTISEPFAYRGDQNNSSVVATSTCSGPDCPENIARLKTQDTDKDGLTDYDELNIYHTSPYLEDSDSDGYVDYEEVKNSTDPNCPAGKVCQNEAENIPATVNNTALTDLKAEVASSTASGVETGTSDIKSILGENPDPTLLRQVLVQSGMSQSELDGISDANLLAAYKNMISSQ
jgi:hypothetical protein